MSDLDLLTVGRVNLDLYAQEIGVEFRDVTGWDAMVGGSPANVAVAAARLGLRTALFSAVGDDLVGEWVLGALDREQVDTEFVLIRSGPHTSLALRAQVAPDHPLAFYRHDPADIYLRRDDAARLPLGRVRVLLVSADALARGSTAETCGWILEQARGFQRTVYIDLDLRDVNWPDRKTYSESVASAISYGNAVIGTTSEFSALLDLEPEAADEAVLEAVRLRLEPTPDRVFVVKQGAGGATILSGESTIHAPSHPVVEASTIGAGDSFAAGLIYARLGGLDWREGGKLASACAAVTVSRFGCSRGFPRLEEIAAFVEQPGVATGTRR